jgi:quercetin dioxygenase-like cupin family protein
MKLTSAAMPTLAGLAIGALAVLAGDAAGQAPGAAGPRSQASKIFDQAMPNVPGKSLTALIVDYPPGGASAPHHHAASGFIFAYVLSGTVRSQIEGGPVEVYRTGESWWEPPAAHHVVSANASPTEPARLLAVIVADTGAQLTTYDP